MDEGREYYIVFGKAKIKMPFFLDKDFQHCYVVRKDYDRIWTVIEDTYNHLSVHPYLVEDYPNLRDLIGFDAKVIRAKRNIVDVKRGMFCIFSCVEVCKAVLGINDSRILTPKQLYRYLL